MSVSRKPAKYSTLSTFFPPPPSFTDKHLPSLVGKVFIVTGAASGVGIELAKILYSAGGTVYIGARSESRCAGAISKLQGEVTKQAAGRLESMVIDLSDLATVKPAVEAFMKKETRLDVLIHNAAVMSAPAGSKDKQVSPLCSQGNRYVVADLPMTGTRSRDRYELFSAVSAHTAP